MSIEGNESLKELKLDVEWIWGKKYPLTVFIQGAAKNIDDFSNFLVILSVHDVGTNPPNSFIPMANSRRMEFIRQNAVFLHICVPGQENGAENMAEEFPSMDQLAELMPQILDKFGVQKCIAIGEGAGADIVCRFAFLFPEMLEGIILIQCTATPQGFFENLKEIFSPHHIHNSEMNEEAWDYLMAHKFGEHPQKERKMHFLEQIRRMAMNEQNIGKYLFAFSNRSDLKEMLRKIKVNAILLSGSKSPHHKNVFQMFDQMNKEKCTLMVAENAFDVLREASEFVAQAIVHICQRQSHLANLVAEIQGESVSLADICPEQQKFVEENANNEEKIVHLDELVSKAAGNQMAQK